MQKYKHQIGVGGLKLTQREKDLVNQVLDSNRLTYGPVSKQFEQEFAKEHDAKYGLFTNSGTSSLQIALQALKVMNNWEDGDEVIVPAVTFVATSNIVLHCNMKPVFVDVEPTTYNIDASKIEEKITKRTKAIIPVHLLGLPAEMGPIMEIAKKHNLSVVEDSCETMFATYKGQKVGSFGDAGCFSTYVAHFLVTGVGGLNTTNDPDLAVKMRSLMNHGRDSIYISCSDDEGLEGEELKEVISRRFTFTDVGYSFRCTELEAALGVGQLERKDEIVADRKRVAEKLLEGLKPFEDRIQLPYCPDDRTHSYMLFGIALRNEKKEHLVNYLENRNIETRDLLPLINQPIYREMFGDMDEEFPVAKWVNENAFYIGCHSYMDDEEIDFVINAFSDYFKEF